VLFAEDIYTVESKSKNFELEGQFRAIPSGGEEELTSENPNVSEEAVKHLRPAMVSFA